MNVRRGIRREGGSVLVVVAIALPVLLLLAALIVDVGDWYTHKRQLQNRADAGATAAGTVYQQVWRDCVGPAGQAKTDATNAIIASAQSYAGTTYNQEIGGASTTVAPNAGSHGVTVVLNSTSFDAGTDNSAGGDPCTPHQADSISSAGYWTDVKVKEVNIGSLFGSFGLPLSAVGAQARVAIRPAISDAGFVPLAIPDNRIVKAQARLFNKCTDPTFTGTPIATVDLSPLKTAFQTVSGTTLWGQSVVGQTTVDPTPFSLPLPAAASGPACGGAGNNSQDYVPIAIQIRVAGRSNIDINNQTCAALQAATSADCFQDLTEIRAYTGGIQSQRPVVADVFLTPAAGNTGCLQDPYYARLQTGQSACTFDARVNIDWGSRSGVPNDFNATLTVAGRVYNPSLKPTGNPPTGEWRYSGILLDDGQGPGDNAFGANTVALNWKFQSNKGTLAVHQSRLGDDPSTNNPSPPFADIVSLAAVTGGSSLGSQFASVKATGNRITSYLFIGLRSALVPGTFSVLRDGTPQGNQSLVCDPDYTPGATYDMFVNGCKPPYSYNDFTDPNWWNASTQHCPSQVNWFKQPATNGAYQFAPWRCIPSLPGGHGAQVTDGLSTRFGNCANPGNGGCNGQGYTCTTPINYPNYDALTDRRIIKVYVVPFGALKNTTGKDEIPVLDFAAYYVTAYASGNNNKNVEPCSGNDNAKLPTVTTNSPESVVGGYFINFVGAPGPVDPNATCDPTQIRPCRAVLER